VAAALGLTVLILSVEPGRPDRFFKVAATTHSAVQCSAVQCSVVQCRAVLARWATPLSGW
jgi:hypothetical protein